MIYRFKIKGNDAYKDMCLTADSVSQLNRRLRQNYNLSTDDIEMIAEYKEVGNDGYELIKSYIDEPTDDYSKELKDKALDLYKNAKYLPEKYRTERMAKKSYKNYKPFKDVSEIYEVIKNNKKYGVFFESVKRGTHQYYILY